MKSVRVKPVSVDSIAACTSEIRAFVNFGDYALERLPKVISNIFKHFNVNPKYYMDILLKAKVPLHVINTIPICLHPEVHQGWKARGRTLPRNIA